MFNYFNPINAHTLILAFLLFPVSVAFLGCETQDGPAEKAGEKVDEAAEEIKDEADDATTD